jgi:PAS domain S-box-containing protein
LLDSYSKLFSYLSEKNERIRELEEAERINRLRAENTNDVIWVLDLATMKLKYVSPSIFQLLGYTVQEITTKSFEAILSENTYKEAFDKFEIEIAIGKSGGNDESGYIGEYQLRHRDGSLVDIEVNASFIKDEKGVPVEVVGITRNITERKIVEQELKEKREQLTKLLALQTKRSKKIIRNFKYIFENSVSAIAFFEIRRSQIFVSLCNKRWADAFGLAPSKMTGMNLNQFDDETAALCKKYVNWASIENKPLEDVCNWRDKELGILTIPLLDDDNAKAGYAVFVTDVTEKQLALKKMHDLEKQITYTGIQVETRERRRLASDLHDNVGPLLSSMNMYLSSLSRKPEMKSYADTLNNIHRILKETIASVREISDNISPQVLNSHGLLAALNVFFETKKNLIPIHINGNLGELRFAETKEVMLYNILREAFNNSIKYANAKSIAITMNITENLITVIYKDDGVGFNLEEKMASVSRSLGLFSMISRIKNMGGIYEIKTSPGNGFTLEVNFLT